MNKIITIITAALGIGLTACAQKTTEAKEMNDNQKTVVVYFSATGTTENVARKIAAAAGADIMEIKPVQPYTDADLDWNDRQSRSSVEMNDPKSRPEIEKPSADLSGYDVVFLGYPIWWNLAPRPVYTFLDSNNLQGKTVIPFATSGGSGISNSASDLKKTYSTLKWQNGKLLNGASDKSVGKWLESLQN